MQRLPRVVSFLLIGVLLFAARQDAVAGSDTVRLFYRPYDYGSMSMFTPWNVVLNGSFDNLQLDRQDRRLASLPYAQGLGNTWRNVVSPGAAISTLGWWKFIRTEVLPLDLSVEGGQWVPNYQLHLIGGGMTYRMLAEWYDEHGASAPEWWAGGTIAIYHVLNEAVENGRYDGYNTDLIADLLIFDWLGVLLFSNDDVARFFGETLQMRDWSNLPVITFPGGELNNNGLYYSMKYGIDSTWSAFYLMGLSNMVGASMRLDTEHSISLGLGARGKHLVDLDPRVNLKSLELVPTGGVFWDRNGSLMASVTASGQETQTVIVQVYPGVVGSAPWSPALWAAWGTSGRWGVGLAVQGGIGVGYGGR